MRARRWRRLDGRGDLHGLMQQLRQHGLEVTHWNLNRLLSYEINAKKREDNGLLPRSAPSGSEHALGPAKA